MASEEGKKITLRSSDGEEFVVEEAVAMLSQTIRHMIEDECAESAIPLPNVNSRILTKVIEYCKKHVDCTPVASATGDEIAVEEEFWMWDYEFVDVDQSVLFNLMVTQTIRHMIEDECAESAIPLPNFNIGNLAKIIQHCKKHAGCTPVLSEIGEKEAAKKAVEEELRSWDADFVKVDQWTLFDLILAADYLNIEGLLDLTVRTVADMIIDRIPEKLRKTFNIGRGRGRGMGF